ncbi:MAG TPA: prolyl oligopeptidase family serine peptidase [Longimicrobium sp.]|jgi:prolyl oligopeptidase|nr:prolyl oligopeptidase family serine peptidase [Longimicrobium sp.]
MKTLARTSAALVIALAGAAATAPAQRLNYPEARTVEQLDEYHGTRVADPYRWLEDTESADTRAWIAAENRVTDQYLAAIPQRAAIRARLTQLWNFPRWSPPNRRGARYFYFRNTGLQNQSVMYVAPSPRGPARVLLDPNTLRADGTEALTSSTLSPDGRLLGYGISSGGSDWQEFRVRGVDTGRDLDDRLRWIKFSGLTWTRDSKGFFYARYAQPAGNALTAAVHDQKVYYHRAGTPQEQDVLVYQRPDQPDFIINSTVTEDGRYLVMNVSQGSDRRNRVHVLDLVDPARPRVQGTVVRLLDAFDASYSLVGNDGPVFYFHTDRDAPRGRLIAVDLRHPGPGSWRTVVPQAADALGSVRRVNGRFVALYMHDVTSRLRLFTTAGAPAGEVRLPGLGAVGGLSGRNEDRELFYTFNSFLSPSTVYRYDFATRSSEPVWPVRTGFDASRYETEQVFYRSKDGTRVPMFVVHRRGMALDGNNPTLLYGYGGFNSAVQPAFSTSVAVWLEMGGVYAVANIRGGSEYGEDWHQAGMLARKQNVFDDFIAAGEYLVSQRYTSPAKLAISGASNGGLLVGAVLNQRPDLFGAALPAVGVMDMLRFNRFTIGWAWVSDYGSPAEPEQFRTLYAYSPLHNIRQGTRYPAVLITTGDHDDRVVPGHSFKYAATLQRAQAGDAPVLIRIETRAGHGAGKPTSMQIDEAADRWAFLVKALGFTPTL